MSKESSNPDDVYIVARDALSSEGLQEIKTYLTDRINDPDIATRLRSKAILGLVPILEELTVVREQELYKRSDFKLSDYYRGIFLGVSSALLACLGYYDNNPIVRVSGFFSFIQALYSGVAIQPGMETDSKIIKEVLGEMTQSVLVINDLAKACVAMEKEGKDQSTASIN